MKLSPNQINRELQEIATSHLQVNSYHWGDLSDIMSEQVIHYPLMNCYLQSGGAFNNNTTDVTIVVEIYDILYKDSDNLNDVESDTKQISRDVYQVLNKSTRWKRFGKINNSSNQKYKWEAHDDVAGWSQNISFKLRDVSGICDLPMQDYDFGGDSPSASCPDVRIINSDLSFDQTTPSGSTFALADINSEVLNTDGDELSNTNNPSQKNLSVTLPDITITDSTGLDITYPTGLNFVCTPISIPVGATLMKTGADETGDPNEGRAVDFFTLRGPNYFGSDIRFTGTTGGYYDRDTTTWRDVNGVSTTRALAYPDNLTCDWSTWDNIEGTFLLYVCNSDYIIDPLAVAISTLSTATIGSFTSFRVGNINEGSNIQKKDLSISMGYPEMYDTLGAFNSHTSTPTTTGINLAASTYYGTCVEFNSLSALRCVVCRTTNVTEL